MSYNKFSIKLLSIFVFVTIGFVALLFTSNTQFFGIEASAWGSGDYGGGCCDDGGGDDGGGNGGGGGGDHGDGGDGSQYNPVCTLSVDPDSITDGDKTKLTWTTWRTSSATIDQGIGTVSSSGGSKYVSPSETTTYTMTVQGYFWREATCDATVEVKESAPAPDPSCELYVEPNSITKGESAKVTWSAENAVDSATLTLPRGDRTVNANNPDGSRTISPHNDNILRLVVKNEVGKEASCTADIEVKKPQPAPDPSCEISAHPSTITKGDSSTLSWNTNNAESASINRGIGSVSTGSGDRSVSPDQTRTYTMTVTNEDGKDATCATKVTVEKEPIKRSCDISASAKIVDYKGSVTLNWTTQNYDSVTINGESVDASGSRTFSNITEDTTYRLEATTDDGNHDCTAEVEIICLPKPAPAPVCEIEADPSTITKGDSSTLTWSTDNADSASINQGIGSVSTGSNQSQSVSPSSSRTYTMTVTNEDGKEATCNTHVSVESKPDPEPVFPACPLPDKDGRTIVDFTSNDKLRTDQGSSAARTGLKSVNLDAGEYKVTLVGWDGYKGRENATQPNEIWALNFLSGSDVVATSGNTTDLENRVRETIRTDVVNTSLSVPQDVDGIRGIHPIYPDSSSPNSLYAVCAALDPIEKEPEPEPKPVCKDFSAHPHTITKGDSSTLNWDVKHAHTITINQGVGEVTNKSEQIVSPAQNTTYTLTAYGVDDHKVQCNTTVKVEKPTPEPDPITCEENVNFSASPSRIDRGNTSTLTWSTSGGITDVSINRGIGDVGTSGSEDVSPNTNTTYTLTASDGTDSIDCNTTLRVDAPTTSGGGGGGGAPAPRCELNISDRNIEAGDDVTLTWNGRNVSDVEITNDEGDVIVSTFDRLFGAKRELFSGSRTITPAQSTTYTMVAESGRRTEECTVAVNVEEEDEVTVEEEREQDPLVAGIAVSDTPYTGFDASTMLATTFYGLLTIWGLFVGYVILRRRQGEAVPAFAARAVGGAAEEQRSINPDLFPQQYTPATSGYTASATAATPVAAAWQAAEATAATPAADAGVVVDAAMQTRMDALEQHAHTKRVLVSRDALALFVSRVEEATEQDAFDTVIDFAAAAYPAEDGWVVVNVPRMEYILG